MNTAAVTATTLIRRIAVSHQCSSQLLARISSCSEAGRSPASPERHSTPTSTSLWRPQRRRQWQTPAAASFASVILENLSGLRHCSSSSPSDEKTQTPPSDENADSSDGEDEIYRGILATQIKLVKGFSLTTSLISLSCQPVLYYTLQSGSEKPMALMLGMGAFMSFFTFATPLLVHYVSKKYVTEMYYNRVTDTYTAITYSLFLRKNQIKFRSSEVHVPDIPGMFTTFKARNVPLFVESGQFYSIYHYGKIMGYEKPLPEEMRWENKMEERRKGATTEEKDQPS